MDWRDKTGTDMRDATNHTLQVNMVAGGGAGAVTVAIDQTTPGTTNRVDIGTVGALEATTPTEYNITLTTANTEYSQALPANTRRLCFRCRTGAQVRYAWVTGKVSGPVAPYQTLVAGAEYALDGVKLAAATLYWASATAGAVIELEVFS